MSAQPLPFMKVPESVKRGDIIPLTLHDRLAWSDYFAALFGYDCNLAVSVEHDAFWYREQMGTVLLTDARDVRIATQDRCYRHRAFPPSTEDAVVRADFERVCFDFQVERVKAPSLPVTSKSETPVMDWAHRAWAKFERGWSQLHPMTRAIFYVLGAIAFGWECLCLGSIQMGGR